jgi:hypothetical protein
MTLACVNQTSSTPSDEAMRMTPRMLLAKVDTSAPNLDRKSREMVEVSLALNSTLQTAVDQSNYAVSAFEARVAGGAAAGDAAGRGAVLQEGTGRQLRGYTAGPSPNAPARESACISCAAFCVATFGLGCAPFFADTIPIVEAGIIPALKGKLQSLSDRMAQFQSVFSTTFSTVAADYASSAHSCVAALGG